LEQSLHHHHIIIIIIIIKKYLHTHYKQNISSTYKIQLTQNRIKLNVKTVKKNSNWETGKQTSTNTFIFGTLASQNSAHCQKKIIKTDKNYKTKMQSDCILFCIAHLLVQMSGHGPAITDDSTEVRSRV